MTTAQPSDREALARYAYMRVRSALKSGALARPSRCERCRCDPEDDDRAAMARIIYDRTGMDLEKCHEVAQECLAAGFTRSRPASCTTYANSRGERCADYRRPDGVTVYGRGPTDTIAIESLAMQMRLAEDFEQDEPMDEWSNLPTEPTYFYQPPDQPQSGGT